MGFIERVLKWLPNKQIVKHGLFYLRRHYLSPRNWSWRRLFLHLINRPDEDSDPHDHPWDFWTLVLWGGYTEYVYDPKTGTHYNRVVKPGQLLHRRAEHVHRIVEHTKGRTWTLVLAGPARRKWGFWTSDGWIDQISYKLAHGEELEPDEWPEDVISDRGRNTAQTTQRT